MKINLPAQHITRGTLTGIISRLVSFLGAFLLIRLMLSTLGNANYGIWITISTSVSLLSFLDLGLGNSLVNYIARCRGDKGKIGGYITLACKFQLVFSAALLALFAMSFPFVNWKRVFDIKTTVPELSLVICVTGAFFILSLVSNSIYSIQRGMKRADLSNLWQLAGSVCYLLSVWLALSFSTGLLWIALATFGVPVLIASMNAVWYLRKERLINLDLVTNISRAESRAFFKVSTLFLYLQVAAIIAFQTDTLVIAHVLDFDEVAKYNVTARLFSVPAILVNIYLQNIWPVYAGSSSVTRIRRLFTRSTISGGCATLIFCVIVFFLRAPIFGAWLPNLIDIPSSLVLGMAVWTVLNIIDINVSTLMNALNILKFQVIFSLLMIIANLALSIFLAGRYGVQGVVWGTVVSTLAFSTVPMFWYLARHFFSGNLPTERF